MKMKPQLWRVVSVWLCVTAFCRCSSCYAGGTESVQEAQRPVSSQDVGSEEDSGEKSHQHKIEENGVLPAHALVDNEQLIERRWQMEEQKTEDVDENKNQYIEAFEVEEPAGEEELETDEGISQREPEHEQGSENPHPEVPITVGEDSASLLPPSHPASEFAAELQDYSNPHNPQDNILDSVSYDAAEPEVVDSNLPQAHCEEEEENNPYDGDRIPPIVLENTSNVHTAGTKTESDTTPTSPTGHGTKRPEANGSYVAQEKDTRSLVTKGPDTSVSTRDPEDIPTFDEWTRKMMEVENEKTQSTHTSNNVAPPSVKKVQKNFNNYASVECGAKILGSNPEAKSTSAILMENMDMYMLNPCSNKIWFIIELCEPIQVKQLDIANFELFSSTPKDFLVSISDRYPTNKWLKLGTFHGRDERTVQTFPLDEHLYAKYVKMFTKYIKVELLSHFGSEHFCPLSLIRVFGTSMVEEYEEIADPPDRPDDQDDDLDYPPGYAPGEDKLSNNLIGSAKDVILNMVNNIAVNVLGGGSEIPGNLSSEGVNVTEPSAQLETSSTTTTTHLRSVSHSPVEENFPDPSILATVTPSSETSAIVISTADASKQVEENIVTPLETEQEESIGSTITLLDKEEFDEEDANREHEQLLQIQKLCPQLTSLSSSCSCAPSLQEYLHWQCSAMLSKKRKCQAMKRRRVIIPILTPACHISPFASACAGPLQHYGEVHQPRDQEQASEQETQSRARASERPPPPPPGSPVESHKESPSKPPLLEPSQTSNLPRPSATDSSSAKPAPVVETPQLSAEEPKPERSQDVLAEDAHIEPSASLSSSIYVNPRVSAAVDDVAVAPKEEKSDTDASKQEINSSTHTPDKTEEYPVLHPTTSPQLEPPPDPPAEPESSTAAPEVAHPDPDTTTELEAAGGPSPITETKTEDFAEDGSSSAGGRPSSSLSDVYAEAPNGTEPNGNTVHGSSQKESVFMRLNNRIKALEMNMSLSGRYLEQLSQRYRKQMEEMQKAFNKTIIKLQNTSTIAEEQDQRQTESIQLLQGQLENLTQLVVNLSVRVSRLQDEVSDRQNYLLLSLALCLCLSLLLCANRCCIPTGPPTTGPEPPTPKSYTYCCPERHFTSCDETGLKRSASYPLIHSLATTEGPEMLLAEETQSLCPANRKRRRRKMKPNEKVETLKPSFHAAPELCNGAVLCNGVPVTTNPAPFAKKLLQPLFRDSPSEGSSEGSSHSDDPSFCGIATACNRICDGLPRPKTRAEKRAFRRRRPQPSCVRLDLLQVPRRDRREPIHISTIQDIMNRKNQPGSGTFGVNVALSGPV
ncbi:SUN domain-containing ossification factor-like isoform 2-T2 [Spinachia spinachia]